MSLALSNVLCGLVVYAGPSLFFFLWKLLAGIRGNLTDGFQRESIVIQQRCVHVRMCARAARKWAQITARRSVETPKTTEAQMYFSFSSLLSPSPDEGADGYLMLIRISI